MLVDNLYWVDVVVEVIEVARLNGSNRFVVLAGHMEKPRSLVVHPQEGWVKILKYFGVTNVYIIEIYNCPE